MTLPIGFTSTDHQVLGAAVPAFDLNGYVGGSLVTLVPNLTLTFTYLGSELKDQNTLLASPNIHFAEEEPSYSGTLSTLPVALGTVFQPTAGAVDLGFANNHSLSPEIWRNAHPERAAAGVSVWFAGLGDSSVLFGLNDRGPDQDWDDFVGRIDLAAVPVPGAVWLLGTALVCLGGIAQARRNSARSRDIVRPGPAR